jgi:hemolysin activation/secretion protein
VFGAVVLQALTTVLFSGQAAHAAPRETPLSAAAPPTQPQPGATAAQTASSTSAPATATRPAQTRPGAGSLYIAEYRVLGAKLLKEGEIGEAVYPFLGPGRTEADVLGAAGALEKVYKEKGYQTVSVSVPPQSAQGGVIFLQVTEAKVGRLRVKGSRYYSLEDIKKHAPSLAEGTVPNFNDVTRDIVALNQWPDRRITPELVPGVEPGTLDINLNVKDSLPLHGSVELNNRYSPNTSELRLNGSASYNNLWQKGHALGVSFQIAPENADDAKVLSAYYQARIPNLDWLTLMVLGTKQDSNVSTLGGSAVAGRGEVLGLRALISLPPGKNFFQSVSFGLDYKHFDQDIVLAPGTAPITAPITYYPITVNYNGTWVEKESLTEFNAGLVFHVRGMGSAPAEFENSRFGADGAFVYLRSDLARTQDLPGGWQAYAKVQGQLSNEPLVSSEQFSAGGLGTARGYLEGEVPGDNAIFGSFELRTPSLLGWMNPKPAADAGRTAAVNEWRLYAFVDGGHVSILQALPGQQSNFDLVSMGAGTRFELWNHFNGSLDAGIPLISQTYTEARDLLLTFRVWADF